MSEADDDNPIWTEADFARARPATEAAPHLVERYLRRQSAARADGDAVQIDPDILAHFRAGGPDWESRINATLRAAIDER